MRSLLTALLLCATTACGTRPPPVATLTPEPTWTPEPTLGPQIFPTFVPTQGSGETPVPALEYDGVWRAVKPGLDVMLTRGRSNGRNELLALTRVDPAQLRIRVRYSPENPRSVRDWFEATRADAVINAGYFLDTRATASLLVSDGQTHGVTYKGFGGMFTLRGAQPAIQWLKTKPFQANPAIEQGIQSTPMLLQGGRAVSGISDNGERNRRSFVAVDRQGRVILGVCQTASWSLTDLAAFLARAPHIGAVDALNLDGGASSGLWVRATIDAALTNSIDIVPSVITVGGD